MKLIDQIAELANYIEHYKKINTDVSAASVGWHISHSLLVLNNVYKALEYSNPEDYVPNDNKVKTYVLENKTIKRGVAQSPKRVLPPENIDKNSLVDLTVKTKKVIVKFDELPEDAFFPHHLMGHFTKVESEKFLEVHTSHHLQIIEDILAA